MKSFLRGTFGKALRSTLFSQEESEGKGRGTYYVLASRASEIGPLFDRSGSSHLISSTPDKGSSTPDKNKEPLKQQQHEEIHQLLLQIGQPIRNAGRSDPDKVHATILELCEKRYLRIDQLVEYLGRKRSTLRDGYLNPMVREGELKLRYPDRVTHPKQAYKAAESD